MTGGKPLRFLLLAVGGWTALRAMALWPVAVPIAVRMESAADAAFLPPFAAVPAAAIDPPIAPTPSRRRGGSLSPDDPAPGQARAVLPAMTVAAAASQPSGPPTVPPPLAPTPLADQPSRWAASAWLIARGGRQGSLLGGQLGASQAGARVTYLVDRGRRIALAGRLAAPLRGRGREAAVGIDWQPLHLPLHLIAEQRVALDGGRGGPTLEMVGGFGPVEVARHVYAEGYGQAGVIARAGGEGFADGAARVAYRIAAMGRGRVDLGAGLWGGAQRGAARLDIGPSLGIVAPVGDRAVRLTLDWRQRVAGGAAPGSGPALSIGSDF